MHRRDLITGIPATVMTLFCSTSWGKNYDEEEAKQNKDMADWFKHVVINSGKSSCCGEGDAYWADLLETPPGADYFFATITDSREIKNRTDFNGKKIKVPYSVVDTRKQGNPTEHNVIFVAPRSGEESSLSRPTYVADKDYLDEQNVSIYCFFPNQQG